MADHTAIEWTDATWNPITGCTLVSEGCRHCYAATLAATRLKNHPSRVGLARLNAIGEAKFTGEVRLNEQWLDQPLRWKRPRRIFVCAHGDLFHEAVPDEWIDRVFAVMALAPRHTFQVLTKRPERARAYLAPFDQRRAEALGKGVIALGYRGPLESLDWPLPNVWLGTSVEDQATADARIPALLAAPAAVRFLSAEPLLGSVSLRCIHWAASDRGFVDALTGETQHRETRERYPDRYPATGRLDWVIAGGESGRGARPMHPDWPRLLRDQCAAAGVPFFFKQWGAFGITGRFLTQTRAGDRRGQFILRDPETASISTISDVSAGITTGDILRPIGKARAGRQLDGRTHDAFPIPTPHGARHAD